MDILSLVKAKTSPYYDFNNKIFNNDSFNLRLCPVGVFGYRPQRHKRSGTFADRKRSTVSAFTHSSRCRLQKRIRELEPRLRTFGRLSYPSEFPSDGRICKRHWNTLVKRIFRKLEISKRDDSKYYSPDGKLFSIVWFFEFQDRGAPHFHFLCTHYINKDWLACAWYEIVGSCDGNHKKFGTRIELFDGCRNKIARYAGKYAGKSEQKVIPETFKNSGRFWGVAGTNSIAAATLFFDAWDEEVNMKSISICVQLIEKNIFIGNTFRQITNEDDQIVGYWFTVDDENKQELLCKEIMKLIKDAAQNIL